MQDPRGNRDFVKAPKPFMTDNDQKRGIPIPPYTNPTVGDLIALPPIAAPNTQYIDLLDVRRSVRAYDESRPMTGQQLAFLLWSTQGIQFLAGKKQNIPFRPVPSGGARHPFEAYVAVQNVEGLKPGLYRYVPAEDVGEKQASLTFCHEIADYKADLTNALSGQSWAAGASAVIFYTGVPYRTEWRYAESTYRLILMDAGHIGQNAQLSAEALGLGSCCMAAYDQELCDKLLGVDGIDEFTVYAVAVGHKA